MGGVFRIIAWSMFRAEPGAVWDRVTDPAELAHALPAWVRWDISDPHGLRTALQHGSDRVFATRLRALGRRIEMPVRVIDASRHLRWTIRADQGWFSPFEHRVRLERAIGGRVRLVHEVIAGPRVPGAWLVARGVEAAMRRVQLRLAEVLPPDPATLARTRVYRLADGDAGHATDALHLDLGPEGSDDAQRPGDGAGAG